MKRTHKLTKWTEYEIREIVISIIKDTIPEPKPDYVGTAYVSYNTSPFSMPQYGTYKKFTHKMWRSFTYSDIIDKVDGYIKLNRVGWIDKKHIIMFNHDSYKKAKDKIEKQIRRQVETENYERLRRKDGK